jgi:signal transduction histidine kinase
MPSRYLPLAVSAFVLVQYYLLQADNRDKHRLLGRKFSLMESSKNRFIASVAHEVRTPLNGILGTCDLLSEQEQKQENFQVIGQCSQVLAMLLENVLVAGSTSEPKIVPVETNMRAFALRLTNVLRGLCFKAHASRGQTVAVPLVTVEVDPDVPEIILISQSALMQVCLNLGSNACKFATAERGPIDLRFRCVDGALNVAVADLGPGIPADFLGHLFAPYQRPSRDHAVAGTGLGLSICRRLCEAMGGTVTYSPRPDGRRRSLFTVVVPFSPAPNASPPVVQMEARAPLLSSKLGVTSTILPRKWKRQRRSFPPRVLCWKCCSWKTGA